MDWVMVHAEIHQPDPDAATMTRHHRRCVRPRFAVEGQPVELDVGAVGDVAVGQDGPLLQHDSEVVVYSWCPGFLRMNDEQTDHAHHLLHGAVRVVEESSRLVQRELVSKFAAGRNWFLADVGQAVHLYRNFQAVPVDRGGFGKVVLEDDPHAIALIDLDRRPWARSVVTPDLHVAPGYQPAFDGLGDKMKLLDAAIRPPGKLRHIRCLAQQGMGNSACRPRAYSRFVGGVLHWDLVFAGKRFRGSNRARAECDNVFQKTTPARHNSSQCSMIKARMGHRHSTRKRGASTTIRELLLPGR